jgi:hypothetical protein
VTRKEHAIKPDGLPSFNETGLPIYNIPKPPKKPSAIPYRIQSPKTGYESLSDTVDEHVVFPES